jgi:ketosteroid isomerase-like protein
MTEDTIRRVVASFNECIGRRDIAGLSSLMTDDHVFVDGAGNIVSGKERCVAAWKGFFAAFPDYRNVFERTLVAGSEATMVGRSICSHERLAGPALWTAKVSGTRVAQWRVYEDTVENRARLGVDGSSRIAAVEPR